jgi:hypothetical protein
VSVTLIEQILKEIIPVLLVVSSSIAAKLFTSFKDRMENSERNAELLIEFKRAGDEERSKHLIHTG